MTDAYMKIHIDMDSIYLREEVCGIEIDSVRLNNVTKATMVQFIQFYNERHRLLQLVVKNDPAHLTVVRNILPMNKVIKGAVTKLTNEYLAIDISVNVDNESYRLNTDRRVLPDIRHLFENA